MDNHRAACQRQHRVLGHFLAVQAWLRGVDCLAIERHDLEVYLALERIREERVRWLQADLHPWFPHQMRYEQGSDGFSLHSLFLSRVPIEEWLPEGEFFTEQRISGIRPGGPKTELFASLPGTHLFLKETDVVRYLAVLDSGLDEPKPLSSAPRGEP